MAMNCTALTVVELEMATLKGLIPFFCFLGVGGVGGGRRQCGARQDAGRAGAMGALPRDARVRYLKRGLLTL